MDALPRGDVADNGLHARRCPAGAEFGSVGDAMPLMPSWQHRFNRNENFGGMEGLFEERPP